MYGFNIIEDNTIENVHHHVVVFYTFLCGHSYSY